MEVVASLTVQVVVAAGASTLCALATQGLSVRPTTDFVLAVGWLVVLFGIGGYAAFIVCLRRIGAAATSALLYLTPPVTTAWTWLMFDRQPTPNQFGELLMGGVVLTLVLRWGAPRRVGRSAPDTPTAKAANSTSTSREATDRGHDRAIGWLTAMLSPGVIVRLTSAEELHQCVESCPILDRVVDVVSLLSPTSADDCDRAVGRDSPR